MTHESSLSVAGSKKDFEATSAQCLEQNDQVEILFKERLKMGPRNFKKLHEVSNYIWAPDAKKYKIVTQIMDELPKELIQGSIEFAMEPVALEMKNA